MWPPLPKVLRFRFFRFFFFLRLIVFAFAYTSLPISFHCMLNHFLPRDTNRCSFTFCSITTENQSTICRCHLVTGKFSTAHRYSTKATTLSSTSRIVHFPTQNSPREVTLLLLLLLLSAPRIALFFLHIDTYLYSSSLLIHHTICLHT